MCLSSFTALSYFSLSLFCRSADESCSHTYFLFPVNLSIHVASHVDEWSWTIACHVPSGTGTSSPRLRVTSSGLTRGFHLPRSGCWPLPIKIPGGSTNQFAISTSIPSTIALPYTAFNFSLSALFADNSFFFSSRERLRILSISVSL